MIRIESLWKYSSVWAYVELALLGCNEPVEVSSASIYVFFTSFLNKELTSSWLPAKPLFEIFPTLPQHSLHHYNMTNANQGNFTEQLTQQSTSHLTYEVYHCHFFMFLLQMSISVIYEKHRVKNSPFWFSVLGPKPLIVMYGLDNRYCSVFVIRTSLCFMTCFTDYFSLNMLLHQDWFLKIGRSQQITLSYH